LSLKLNGGYLQLCDVAKIYNPHKKEYVKCENVEEFIVKKCLMGQSKDDIFNVKTPNDWGQTDMSKGKRKQPLGIKTAEKIINEGYENWLEQNFKCKDYENPINLKENFHRNRVLIDWNYIPKTLQNRVIEKYIQYNFPPPRNIYQFFKKFQFRKYMENFTNVEKRLMELY
jgi:hypothetical protein